MKLSMWKYEKTLALITMFVFVANLSAYQPLVSVLVTGRWIYRDRIMVLQALKYARIEIWDYNTPPTADVLLGTTSTDQTGSFQLTVYSAEPEGPDIYVKVLALNGVSVWVGSNASDSASVYTFSTTVYHNIGGGNLDVGVNILDSSTDRMAWYIYDLIADEASQYFQTQVGWVNNYNLAVQWYPGSTVGTYYDTVNTIFLQGSDRWDSDVILHEYAHFVMDKIYSVFPPPGLDCTGHEWAAPLSAECAWLEGWATFLQAAIQGDPSYDDTEEGIPIHRDLEPPTPAAAGADVEGAVVASLWDVFDSVAESWDSLSSGINGASSNGLWKITRDGDPTTALQFLTQWFASTNGKHCKIASIFKHHQVGKPACLYNPAVRR